MIISEIGWNFLGDLNLAKKMIKSSKDAGCKHVKFQLWNPNNLVAGAWDKDGRRQIYEKAYLDENKYIELYEYSKSLEMDCFASIFDKKSYEILKSVSQKLIKIPSVEAYDLDLIKKSLKDFKNVIVSTGALKKKELENLLQFKNEKNFFILHCVSSYPLEYKNSNFEKFFYLKDNFKNVGYSGHALGINDAIFALSHGAKIVEKHFTIDNNLEGRDNKFAILPKELKFICDFEKDIKNMEIKHGLDLQINENEVYNNYRGRFRKN
tara:strand:+ start:1682 stop:2479 length:798 start_codon:yes stop_codon:yes gene_type:complete